MSLYRWSWKSYIGGTLGLADDFSDERSNFMRQQAMSSRMLYGRPIPVGRAVQGIADRQLRIA